MKIVIFTGGTGSVALQRGLYDNLESRIDGVDIKVIVNAYDNGLSTGAVRRVMSGQILGPSDVRKNHTTQLQMLSPNSHWQSFLNARIDCDAHRARNYCTDLVRRFTEQTRGEHRHIEYRDTLTAALEAYFTCPLAQKIDYSNFSLANILYAGLAKLKGNSLRAAAKAMAELMGIPDRVLLNDDKSLFLGAVSRSGHRIADEAQIVVWGKGDDPLVDVFFTDPDGNSCIPHLCLEAWQAIVEADLIILSSGTLWSSLIPTYASWGFTGAIKSSKATVIMVMNRAPDKDMPSCTASDIINALVPRYFDVDRLHVLTDTNSRPQMCELDHSARYKVASFSRLALSTDADRQDKHDSARLFEGIAYVFFKEHLKSDYYLFDYDGTVVGRDSEYPKSSAFNVRGILQLNRLANVGICTGNTIRALRFEDGMAPVATMTQLPSPLIVFADGGVNEYLYETSPAEIPLSVRAALRKCISPDSLLPASGTHNASAISDTLRRAGIPAEMIDCRGGAVIAIRPVDRACRRALICLLTHLLEGSGLEVRESGRTTVEICVPRLSKICALKYLLARSPEISRITYVGDEFDDGNDREIKELATKDPSVSCLQVDSPAKTAFFISALTRYLGKSVST